MIRRVLGSSGLHVGVMGLGGAGLGGVYGPVTDEQAVAAVHAALELGVDFIDTAPSYLESERRLGLALADRRDRVTLATKAGILAGGGRALTYDAVLRSVDESMDRLQTDHIDLLQYHEIGPGIAGKVLADDGPLGALRRLRDEGVARHLGVTGRHLPSLVQAVQTGEFVAALTYLEYSPLTLAAQDVLFPVAAEHGVAVIAGSPLAAGVLAGGDLDARAPRLHLDPAGPLLRRARQVTALAAAHGWPVSALALAFELADPRVAVIIPGAISAAEVAANIAATYRPVAPDLLLALREVARS